MYLQQMNFKFSEKQKQNRDYKNTITNKLDVLNGFMKTFFKLQSI